MTCNPIPRALEFVASWRFAAAALALVTSYELLLFAMLLLPSGQGDLATFAEEFRIWCFGLDPATGSMQTAYIVTMLTSPLLLAFVVLLTWGHQLAPVWRARKLAFAPWLLGAFALSLGSFALMARIPGTRESGELPFPAESLRTAIPAHDFTLTDQDGKPFTLASTRGKVVLLTAVYATCGSTCPMLMAGAKDAVAALTEEERKDLQVVGITLDPAHDTPEVLAAMVKGRELDPAVFRFVTGPVAMVEGLLDAYSVAREKNATTGMIDHANLFLLLDREHKLAYRLTLGERQQRWLVQALRLLLAEVRTRP